MRILIDIKLLLKLLLWGVSLAVFSFYRTLNYGFDLEGIIMESYGNINRESITWVIPLFIWLLPLLILNFYIGNHIHKQMGEHAVYIFTRTNKRIGWFLQQVTTVLIYILFFQIVVYATTLSLGVLYNLSPVNIPSFLVLILQIFIFSTLGLVVSILLVNVLSIIMNVIYSSSLIIALNFLFILIGGIWGRDTNFNFTKWLPFTQNIVGWQSEDLLHIKMSDLYFPFFYLATFLIVIVLFGCWRIKNQDILAKEAL